MPLTRRTFGTGAAALGMLAGCSTLRPPAAALADASPPERWARVLRDRVDDEGRVDFTGLARDPAPLDAYVAHVAETPPKSFPDRSARLAYLVNSYNALSMWSVLQQGIPERLGLHAGPGGCRHAGLAAPLREATAVWFDGGRQARLIDAYGDTETGRALRGVLERGGLIAGAPAGATIQGSYLVRGGRGDISAAAGRERAFGYLQNVAVDQHVDARGRNRDLAPLVAARPELLGVGLDEGTAIVVRRDAFTVVGLGRVLITDVADHAGQPFRGLRAGDRFDLARRERLP